MSRIPFVAAVVGALLIGGATTGGTFASWKDTVAQPGDSITSGALDFDRSPTADSFSVVRGGPAVTRIITVTDKSAGKNLNRRIQPSVSTGTGLEAHVYTVVGGACTTSTAGDFTGAQGATYQVCLSVSSPSGSTATSATATVSFAAKQTRNGSDYGWSVTKNVPVSVTIQNPITPGTPALTCVGFQNDGDIRFSWTGPSGATYPTGTTFTVYRSTQNQDATYAAAATPPAYVSPYDAAMPNDSVNYYFRVKATLNGASSGWSNTLVLKRTGNGRNAHTCNGATP